MEYVRLGSTGPQGQPSRTGLHELRRSHHSRRPRMGPREDEAQPFFQQAIDLGITFWDTANVYQAGTSEKVVGRAIRQYSRREDIVLATKLHGKMHDGPGGQGLSRKAVLEQIDASLGRQIHRFDPDTPVEETMEALHDVVKAGRSATSAHLLCTHGSSPSCSTPPTSADGHDSPQCRISTT
jgi:1-deoxyxylulose-5-phosphate synthase